MNQIQQTPDSALLRVASRALRVAGGGVLLSALFVVGLVRRATSGPWGEVGLLALPIAGSLLALGMVVLVSARRVRGGRVAGGAVFAVAIAAACLFAAPNAQWFDPQLRFATESCGGGFCAVGRSVAPPAQVNPFFIAYAIVATASAVSLGAFGLRHRQTRVRALAGIAAGIVGLGLAAAAGITAAADATERAQRACAFVLAVEEGKHGAHQPEHEVPKPYLDRCVDPVKIAA
ncbi:MAG TPA: hypothetical protein VM600_04175, partial [Actinomycetota bacterium]|nr:hypothetical protein [Actinomycetota bacterium]